MALNAGMAAMTKLLAAGMKLDKAVSACGFQLTDEQLARLESITNQMLELEHDLDGTAVRH